TTPTVTTNIIDDDTSSIALSQAQPTVAEGATTSTYTVSLSGGVGLGAHQSVTFTLDSASGTAPNAATEGVDFSALVSSALSAAPNILLSGITTDTNGTIHVTATNNSNADLASGTALLTFTIATTQDSVVEATENFAVTLASATATVTTPTVTTNIIDDDTSSIALSQAQATVAEGATTSTYTVSLSGGVGLGAHQSVTFTLDSASGTAPNAATEGVDFSALVSSALSAAPNILLSGITTDTNGTIHVTATNNSNAELASGP